MTYSEAIKEMRKQIDALQKEKTDEDRLSTLVMIKALVEAAEEPLKRRRDKRKTAYHAKTKIIKKPLKQFLTALDRIESKHGEIGDTDVREKMYNAIHAAFIMRERGFSMPEKFGMFSDAGNALVRAALQNFVTHPEVVAAGKTLKIPLDRLAAFQDDDVDTSEGTIVFEYFGYRNKPVPW